LINHLDPELFWGGRRPTKAHLMPVEHKGGLWVDYWVANPWRDHTIKDVPAAPASPGRAPGMQDNRNGSLRNRGTSGDASHTPDPEHSHSPLPREAVGPSVRGQPPTDSSSPSSPTADNGQTMGESAHTADGKPSHAECKSPLGNTADCEKNTSCETNVTKASLGDVSGQPGRCGDFPEPNSSFIPSSPDVPRRELPCQKDPAPPGPIQEQDPLYAGPIGNEDGRRDDTTQRFDSIGINKFTGIGQGLTGSSSSACQPGLRSTSGPVAGGAETSRCRPTRRSQAHRQRVTRRAC